MKTMKFVAALMALALAAGAIMAQSTTVQSDNVVGYNTVTLDKEWTILGINFENCSNGQISLQEAVPFATGMQTGAVFSAANNIQVQNASGGYDTYYLSNGQYGKSGYNANLIGKWVSVDANDTLTQVSIPVGKGAWYISRNAKPSFEITIVRPFSL